MFSLKWLRDTFERTLATYVEALIMFLIALQATDAHALISNWQAAALSAIAPALAVLKAALASFTGNRQSASLDPKV